MGTFDGPLDNMRRHEFFYISIVIVFLLVITAISEGSVTTVPNWYKGPFPTEPAVNETPPETTKIVEMVVLSNDGYTQEGQRTEIAFEIEQDEPVQLNVTLAWTDDYGTNDEFGLSMSLEGKEVGSVKDTNGKLELQYGDGNGTIPMGNYTITISAVNCPGLRPNSPIDRDQGNDWSLTVRLAARE